MRPLTAAAPGNNAEHADDSNEPRQTDRSINTAKQSGNAQAQGLAGSDQWLLAYTLVAAVGR